MTPLPARRFPWLVLAYLGPLAIVALIATQVSALWTPPAATTSDDDRTAVAWHAWQGFLLAVIETLVLGALTLLAGYTVLSHAGAGITLGVLAWLVWVVVLGVHLAAIVAAINDRRLELPLLGTLASRLAR